jgi:NAD(P)-dependent dehydrogenase (short-subunit alcohol dehydrogenase family)
MGRHVLITGASSGIGLATARLFAERGFRVFGISRRPRPDLEGVEMLQLDVRSDDSVRDCLAAVTARGASIDVLINNVGVMHLGIAEEATAAEARSILETNLLGAARTINAVLPGMRECGHGRIINVGSLAAWIGEPAEAYYAASKAALARYTEAVRYEVWPFGIRVSLIEPGAFKTGVLQAASVNQRTIAGYDAIRQAARHTLHDSMQKAGDPDTVAELIVRVAMHPSPRLRYGAGPEARSLPILKLLLPQRIFDHLIRRAYRL